MTAPKKSTCAGLKVAQLGRDILTGAIAVVLSIRCSHLPELAESGLELWTGGRASWSWWQSAAAFGGLLCPWLGNDRRGPGGAIRRKVVLACGFTRLCQWLECLDSIARVGPGHARVGSVKAGCRDESSTAVLLCQRRRCRCRVEALKTTQPWP